MSNSGVSRKDDSEHLALLESAPVVPSGSGIFNLGKNAWLIIAMVSLLIARAVDTVLYYRIAKLFPTYTWMMGAVIMSVGYMAVLWPIVWYKMYVSKTITKAHRAFPHKQLIIMASFDALSGIIGTWPLPYIPGSMVNVLSNAVLPLTMIMSTLFLRTRYHLNHYVGAALIITGMVVCIIPSFSGSGDEKLINGGLWIPILMLSQIPDGASNVYKEFGLKGFVSDVWHVNAWISVYQVLWGLLTIPTVFIPWPAPPGVDTGRILPSELFTYLGNGWSCFAYGENIAPGSPDVCTGVLEIFLLYLFFNLVFNQLMLVVFKNGSSVLAVVASAVRLPLVNVLLMSSFIAGPAQDSITIYAWIALVILIGGLIVYRLKPERANTSEGEGLTMDTEAQQLYGSLDELDEEHPFGKLPAVATGYSPQVPKRM